MKKTEMGCLLNKNCLIQPGMLIGLLLLVFISPGIAQEMGNRNYNSPSSYRPNSVLIDVQEPPNAAVKKNADEKFIQSKKYVISIIFSEEGQSLAEGERNVKNLIGNFLSKVSTLGAKEEQTEFMNAVPLNYVRIINGIKHTEKKYMVSMKLSFSFADFNNYAQIIRIAEGYLFNGRSTIELTIE
jgi:hypothetical protein